MGVARLQQIQEGLLSGDMPSDTPIAMIEQASTPQQRQHACRLDDLCEQAAAFKLQSPAVLVIGEVVSAALASGQLNQMLSADPEPTNLLNPAT